MLTPNKSLILENISKLDDDMLTVTDFDDILFIGDLYREAFKDKIYSGSYGSIFSYDSHSIIKLNNRIQDYIIIGINNDNTYIMNHHILDGVGSIYFNHILKDITPCTMDTYGVFIVPYEERFNVAILMEKLDTLNTDDINNNLWYILFLVLYNIYIGQCLIRFNHNDLHLNNIVKKKYNEKTIKIRFNEEIIEINSIGWIPIIIDYGFCSFDLDQLRVCSHEMINYSGRAFDSYYDSFKIFESLMIYYGSNNLDPEELITTFLDVTYVNQELIDTIMIQSNLYHTININFLYVYNNDNSNNLRPIGPLNDILVKSVLEILMEKMYIKSPFRNIEIQKPIDNISKIIYVNDPYIEINNFITYHNIIYEPKVIPFHDTQPISSTLNIHMIEINNTIAQSFPMKYVAQCCKQNVFDFISGKIGVVINGTYFTPEGQPIGSSYYYPRSNNPIKDYISDYAYIIINNNNNIEIKTSLTNDEKIRLKLSDNIYMTAPLLVLNGINKFTNDKVKEKHHDIYKYGCYDNPELPPDSSRSYHNCNFIYPGQLYHLGNANPRTIMAFKDNITYFIVIEGRTQKYKGATIEQMQDFLINYLIL